MKHIFSLALIAISLGSSAAHAGTKHQEKREARQEARINQGIASGQLNEKEAARLEKGQQHIDNMEDKAMADGKMSKREKLHIEHAQDKQSRKIFREKHDRQNAVQ